MNSDVAGLRRAAWLVSGGAVLSGPVAMMVVQAMAPQPAWSGVDSFIEHYHPVQILPYALGCLLLGGFALFTAAVHAVATSGMRVRASAALVFTGIYAALVFTNYTIQLGYIPRMLSERPAYLADLTMANPASFAWFLEMFGYAAMGVATWFVSPAFGGSRRGDVIRYLLIANGIMSIAGAACVAIYDRWVFSLAGMLSFGAWNVVVPLCFLLIAATPGAGVRSATKAI